MSDDGFADYLPSVPGLYDFKSEETGGDVERVAITREKGILWCHSRDLGKQPLKHFHDGLTWPKWKFVA